MAYGFRFGAVQAFMLVHRELVPAGLDLRLSTFKLLTYVFPYKLPLIPDRSSALHSIFGGPTAHMTLSPKRKSREHAQPTPAAQVRQCSASLIRGVRLKVSEVCTEILALGHHQFGVLSPKPETKPLKNAGSLCQVTLKLDKQKNESRKL